MIEVYSYGGCTTCGGLSNPFVWMESKGYEYTQKNAQIEHIRREAMERAAQLTDERPYFPMFFIGNTVVFSFQPEKLEAAINNQ